MKINAPDKIYIDGCSSFACENNDDNIEYTRTDAFIEKACAYLDSIGHRYIIDSFRKYIEKE